MNKLIITLLFILHPFAMFSEVISEVRVTGNIRASSEFIIRTSRIQQGKEFTDLMASDAIKSLYQEDIFQDISLDTNYISPGSLEVVIEVTEYPTLDSFHLQGVNSIKESDLRNWISQGSTDTLYVSQWIDAPFRGRTVTPRKLMLWENFIYGVYKKQGFVGTEVSIQVGEPNFNGEVQVFVSVKEGKKITIAQINFIGNNSIPRRDLRYQINNREWGFYGWEGFRKIYMTGLFRRGLFNQDKFENEDISLIEKYYHNHGFPDARVDSTDYLFNSDSILLKIDVFIHEGDKKYFGITEIQGNQFFSVEFLEKYLSYSSGDLYRIDDVNNSFQNLSTIYADSGMIYAQIIPREEKTDSLVNITWEISEGPRVKVRLVDIMGNFRTRDKVIRRQVTMMPGDYFSISKFYLTVQNVYNLGFFENVLPDVQRVMDSSVTDSTAYVDLLLEVIEARSGQIKGGATYSQGGGVGAYAAFSIPNLLGRGETFELEFDINSQMWNFNVGYSEPWVFDTPWSLGGRLYATTYDMDYYKYRKLGGQISASRPYHIPSYLRFYTSYTIERVEVEVFDIENTSDYIRSQDGVNYLSELGLSVIRDSRDRYFNTTKGSYFLLRTNIAGGFLQGDINLREHLGEARWYFPIYEKKVNSFIPTNALMLRTRMGVISDVYSNEIGDVPIYRLYRLGGTGQWGLRGYDDFSIGVVEEGEIIGGSTAMLFNAEYSIHLNEAMTLLFFGDMGNTWRDPYQVDFENGLGDLYKGAGAGFRMKIPMMGIIGIDYAYGFSSQEWVPHIQFGVSF
ncbi:MAG: outer membrane protein assembly factor BamA [bacterium]